MAFTIRDNCLSTLDLLALFKLAGWGTPNADMAETSIKNSYATFEVLDGERTIAMARLLGDGGMAFFLKDLIVHPDYQGQGVGKILLSHIEEYIKEQLKPGWDARFQLMSAKGKDGFYKKMGYTEHPHEYGGPGFTKMLKKD